MKRFLFAIALLASPLIASDIVSKSTDTVSEPVVEIPFIVPVVEVPVEHKIVELKITPKVVFETPESVRGKKRKASPLPFLSRATCSGAFVTDTGDILTARHCVDLGADIEVTTYDRRSYQAVVMATSPVHDLALIHIDRRDTPYFELATRLQRGEPIAILGSPLSITDVLAVGVVARIDGDRLLVDCSALPGNSGGPIFNTNRELVGVLTNGYMYGFGVTHLNVGQGLDAVSFFLEGALKKLPWREKK